MVPAALPRHLDGKPVARRADELLYVACLLVDNTTSIAAATRLTGATVSSHNVSTLTRRDNCADVLHALILLADHLDTHGAPIDYARRRALFTTRTRFLDPQLRDLQRRLRSNHCPGPAHAQRWIFQALTGSPPHPAHPDVAPSTGSQRLQYQRFRWRILPAEAELLHQTAHTPQRTRHHGINEPVACGFSEPAPYSLRRRHSEATCGDLLRIAAHCTHLSWR
ncbi:hypothetical protein [Streptomyces sp. NPDC048442]|uniref:hypothetical protein n=1 Tax=Streptomyces sp. NPDC048442 TaxID=3154823 RepID=UPI0034308367